jgi:hypothetical protein
LTLNIRKHTIIARIVEGGEFGFKKGVEVH